MNQTITALLHAPGLDPAGVSVQAGFVGGQLRLEWGEAIEIIPAGRLTVKTGGFDGRQWFLEWPASSVTASLLLPADPATKAWLSSVPELLSPQVERHLHAERRRERRFRLGLGVGLAVLLLPALLLLLFGLNAERIAGWAADRISLEQEQALGALAYAQVMPSLKPRRDGPAAALIGTIGARLTQGSRYTYRWILADSPEVNAFAMPGGTVVVYTGLLKRADSAEEVAGVLAHEVQHVELRHSLKNLLHSLGWRAVLALALGDVTGSVWGDMAHRLGSLSYGRELEREADLGALQALRNAGIGARGLLTFFARLAESEGPDLSLLSSHPASRERIVLIEQAIAAQGNYAHSPLTEDWQGIRAGL